MAALTKDRQTDKRDGNSVVHPVAAATQIHAGSLVALDANGWLVSGSTSTTLKAVGRAEEPVDNSSGANGDLGCRCGRRAAFRFANDSGDPIDRTHIGSNAYIVDDQTVAATDGGATRSVAGKIIDVDAAGVWVEFE